MPFFASIEGAFGFGRIAAQPPNLNFNYPDFSSTAGLSLVSVGAPVSNLLYLTTAVTADVGNVYRSTAIAFNRSFSFEWNFECSGGSTPPADGFCLQWTPTNTTNGTSGGGVGYVSTAIHALWFQTYTNNQFVWYKNNVSQTTVTGQNFYRNLYYWADYDKSTSIMRVYFNTTYSKPASANFTLTGFSFDSTSYYIGFGAATGGATENHILKSMKLTFT